MKTLILAAIRCSLMFTAVAALSLAYPASVQAVPTTYTYVGQHFTFAIAPYTTSDFVTAMVTLAGPLGANMPLTTVTPIAFTLTDGVQTISNLNATSSFFFFITGPTGAIVNWSVAASTPGGTFITSTWADGDEGKLVTGRGFNRMAGVWTITGAVPDTGSTLTMLTLTLMVLGLVARRFQRAAG